jgi:uncharacterized protein (TIGR02453 family)
VAATKSKARAGKQLTAALAPAVLPRETFRFLRELSRHNTKAWMDAHRDRYKAELVEPFHALFERLAPAALRLNSRFVLSGRTGDNFSRINRDIRFAKDKTPYSPRLYLFFAEPDAATGQFYVGAAPDSLTIGFRIYGQEKTSTLVRVGRARGAAHTKWIAKQRSRLARGYDSYWYSTEMGEWTKHSGWPVAAENWARLQGWIIRRKLTPAAASRSGFEREILKAFRDMHPLHKFIASPNWKP